MNFLWSDEDVHAGHFRRYTPDSLKIALSEAGFEVEFTSYFFAWLVPVVFLLRALPFRLFGRSRNRRGEAAAVASDHRLPAILNPLVSRFHEWELRRLRDGKTIPFGTSVMGVATCR